MTGGVIVTLSDGHGVQREVRCDYLVGCDGASSSVRGALGLSLDGRTFAEKWLIVDLENSPSPTRDTLVFCNAQRPCVALPGPNLTRRFEFKLKPGESVETIVAPECVQTLLRDHGADPGSTIKRKTVYTFHARLAKTWTQGRIFLAGDACHLTPPFAGQGMNSGIRDAHNIAWKLAAVVQSRLGPNLLRSYELERRDHVDQMIELALRMGRIMAPRSRLVGALTRMAFYGLTIWPPARDYFAQMKYKPKPRFADGFLIPDRTHTSHTLVGRLLPQPTVTLADGRSVPLDDLLGDGFALVGFRQNMLEFERLLRHPVWTRLGVQGVLLEVDPSPSDGRGPIPVAVVPPETFGRSRRRSAGLYLLVRPDRYVAAAFRGAEADLFARKLEQLCSQTWT